MVRYPKTVMSDTSRGVQGGMNTSQNAVVPAHYVFQNNSGTQVAPSRYSNVRKVVFSMNTGKFGNGTTSTCQMGIRIASTTTPALTVQKFNLPFSSVIEGAADYGLTPTFAIRPVPRGPITTIEQVAITANERDRAQLLFVEFDRDDSDADDFFAAWDSFDDDDDYMMIQPSIQGLTDDAGGAVIAYRFKQFQITVVQEDDFKNNTSTDWHSFVGVNDALEGTIAFQGALFAPRMQFQYIAADYNGLDSVSVLFYGNEPSNATQLTVRVFNVTDSLLVFDENFALPAGGVSYYVARTQDFRDQLIDGKTYYIDYLLDAANSTGDPRGTGYFTLIQKNFTRTSTFHQTTDLSFTPTAVDRNAASSIYFDPAWYAGFGAGGIRSKKMVSGFAHNNAANNPIQSIRVDTDLLSNDDARQSVTAVDLTPSHTFTGNPIVPQHQLTDILTNDPLDEIVPVRLSKSFLTGSTWLSAPGDFPGHVGVYYAYTVPRSSEALSQFGSGDPAFDTDIGPI